MRKTTVATIVVLAISGVAMFFVLGGPINTDRRLVENLSTDFMEDLQFKDFRRSASYHHKLEHDRVDIGKTLEKLFLVKPESLDIQQYRIIKSEIDSTGDRARVHIRVKYHKLNIKDEPEDNELILYWMLRNPDCPIGAKCVNSECHNDRGEALWFAGNESKPLPESEAQKIIEKQKDKKKQNDDPPEKLSCEVGAEQQWFMNLDSTLKEKRYNY